MIAIIFETPLKFETTWKDYLSLDFLVVLKMTFKLFSISVLKVNFTF